MDTREILTAALKIFNGGENWVTGEEVVVIEEGRLGYCSVGSVYHVNGTRIGYSSKAAIAALGETLKSIYPERYAELLEFKQRTNMPNADYNALASLVVWFNDERAKNFTDVEQIFEKTIANL